MKSTCKTVDIDHIQLKPFVKQNCTPRTLSRWSILFQSPPVGITPSWQRHYAAINSAQPNSHNLTSRLLPRRSPTIPISVHICVYPYVWVCMCRFSVFFGLGCAKLKPCCWIIGSWKLRNQCVNVVRYVNAVAEYMDICVDMTAHAHLHRHLGHVYTGGRIDYCMKTLSACLLIRGCGASANCLNRMRF